MFFSIAVLDLNFLFMCLFGKKAGIGESQWAGSVFQVLMVLAIDLPEAHAPWLGEDF